MAAPSISPKRARNHLPKPLMWPPLKIGHRWMAGKEPENTLASFKAALREGAEGISLDVQLSSDGIPVVICDAQLCRTSSASHWVQDHPANTLIQLDADSRFNRQFPSQFKGRHARILLLSEILHWLRTEKCMALVAITDPTPDADLKVIKAIDQARVRHLTRVVASSLPELQRLRQLDAKAHLGLRFTGRPPAIDQAKALGAEVLLPHWKATSPSFIRRAHRACILVIAWTVDSARQMHRTILEGVDGIITNHPDRLTRTVARLQKTAAPVSSQANRFSPIERCYD
jgi:glycerophosphoryl diester phosphodiesterase